MNFLVLLKIGLDAITAASGVFGLLTEFKTKHNHITRNGKIALIGIVVGFLLSAVISVRDSVESEREKARVVVDLTAAYEKGKAEIEKSYENGSRKVLRPLHSFSVSIVGTSTLEDNSKLSNRLRSYFKGRGPVAVTDIPNDIQKALQASEWRAPLLSFSIFRVGSASCKDGIKEFPDLFLIRAGGHSIRPDPALGIELREDDHLDFWASYELHLAISSQEILSIDDLRGAVLQITEVNDGTVGSSYAKPVSGYLRLGEGIDQEFDFKRFGPGATDTSRGNPEDLNRMNRYFCYTFPQKIGINAK